MMVRHDRRDLTFAQWNTGLIAVTGALTLILSLLSGPVAASPGDYTLSSAEIAAADGVVLHADIFRPAGLSPTDRTPVAMVIGPYFDKGPVLSPETPEPIGWVQRPDFIAAGYTVVHAHMRGFGRSRGCMDWGGPRDVSDAGTFVKWAASQPWSTGKVGVLGNSYEAWAGVMALAARPQGLAAVALFSPIANADQIYFMNGVRYGHVWHATPASYAADDLMPAGSPPMAPDELALHYADSATHPDCYAQNLAFSHVGDATLPYWRERELVAAVRGTTVPVFWTHGFLDENTKPDNIPDLWKALAGPKRAWFGQFIHGGPPDDNTPEGEGRFDGELLRWFDRYVKGTNAPVENDAPVWLQDDRGKWRSEPVWPPADAAPHSWPILSGAYVDAPGNWGEKGGPHNVEGPGELSSVPTPTGIGTWTFTKPLPYQAHLAGVASIDVEVTVPSPQATLVGLLYDVAPDGKARLISRGARLLDLQTKARLDLYPQDWILQADHRLGLLLSGSDETWFDPGHTGRPVPVAGGTLTIPFLRNQRTVFDDGQVIDRLFGTLDRRIDIASDTITGRTVDAPPPPRQQ
jgi:predicted acyl esterase